MHTGGWDANGAQTKQDAGQSGQFATDVATEPGKLGANAVISPAAEADEHHREDGHLSTGDTVILMNQPLLSMAGPYGS